MKGRPYLSTDDSVLDAVNLRLIEALDGDARLSMAALARLVGMSAPAVTERVQRLERAGVIRGYRLDIDPAAVGLPVAAWVRVRPGPGQLTKIAELAKATPEVVECHRITGEDCFLMRIQVAAVDALEEVLDKFLLYGQTTSSIAQSSPVPPRRVPLPANGA
ncbi:MAG TPA: Lrp/AsnC family transcriptional regulator [Micromonosporaceae bacterium]|nr:Lrp/AsnC family transcriptional regulator [Micromonosporaceae bacterium]